MLFIYVDNLAAYASAFTIRFDPVATAPVLTRLSPQFKSLMLARS